MVYVDDFRMSGPKENLPKAWQAIRTGKDALSLDDPKPPDRELGCFHRRFAAKVNGLPVRAMEYDMRDFMKSLCQVLSGSHGIDGEIIKATRDAIFGDARWGRYSSRS